MIFITACAQPRVGMRHLSNRAWTDAVWPSNGAVELVVAPSIGRIMRYGRLNAANALWENPAPYGQAPGRPAVWASFGGDKV